uniref:Uncharacterized protein n=1 Tax=Tanacetum cinerariifolium TaxID=118510 RepID=A0A6L2MJ05_TANCI|nr:hypothetical protein [Tanacetum cinerariifolium]
MTTGTLGYAKYAGNTWNAVNGVNKGGARNVGNNGKGILKNQDVYDLIIDAAKGEEEDQELKAPGIFIAMLSETF